ncbi:aminodeoxychorismate/anthranilate synthase component II [Virgibacillus phasianinus]|uniref:Aminodeoxychorismate/anthranilate synthase component II n=1 Tax=Virgibacillus phasianinus TaxID=2017483 RepID=A0A220U0E9_9BACI|nr:aminodeoxychorismate/anthranilate synthase component II [Virgibacillus phasianinus]ASK61455.1 aminodeoxychorismate/anthranilate synthase component II [Virgibacillus phasianinus]
MILLIDNYDSFTYNIFHYFSSENVEVKVYRNDQLTSQTITELNPEAIIISPGPGTPETAGNCIQIVKDFYQKLPILGICLGHQIIASALGSNVVQANVIKHGKTSRITHNGIGLFSYLTQPLEVMRYHSLVVDPKTLSEELEIVATSMDDNEIMGIKHFYRPVFGIQFHPESIGTLTGRKIIQNFLGETRKAQASASGRWS